MDISAATEALSNKRRKSQNSSKIWALKFKTRLKMSMLRNKAVQMQGEAAIELTLTAQELK